MSSQRINDLMQSTASESEIRFYFITKTGTIDEASEDLKYSFQIIADFASSTENLEWLSEADCLLFDAPTLNKKSVFVLEEFVGEAFDHLSSTKAIVIGPRVLINCQLTNDVVPNIASPMYTLAMRDAIVCVSGINLGKREEIHKLVGFMGGLWTKDLVESTTHLITNTIKSPKYEKAALRNMKIMTEDWISEVWKLSKKDDNSYITDAFFQKYKMPIFHKLAITSTGISEADKREIAKLINDNGGTFTGSFQSKVTDILITQPNQKNNEKFKAAIKCRKECLMVDWVRDSISKGYSMPYVNYRIYTGQSNKTSVINSTQISNRSLRADIFDSTHLSAIMSDYSIAETTSGLTPQQKSPPKRSNHKQSLDSIDISQVKHAVGCLDGCTIWLCGFDGTDVDKLKKIINIGGAFRTDEHGPNVDYVIVGKPNSVELSTLKSLENSNIVTVDWLVSCVNAKRIADPKDFLYKLQTSNSDTIETVPSPASRKNIEAMNPFRRPDYVPRSLNLIGDDNEKAKTRNEKTLLDQYALPSNSKVNVQREETGADTAEDSEQIDPDLFRGLTFALFGFSEESTLELSTEVNEAGGLTVEENDVSKSVDYLVVPTDVYDFSDCHYNAKEMVTDLWVQECLGSNKLVNIEYYHRAILLRHDCKPLHGLNIVFSTYTGPERDYLYSLARALGGEVNDRYMRNQSPILICPTPDGKKYLGAIKWKLPVVTCEWLKQCFELKKKISMRHYVVGESCGDDEENVADQNDQSGRDVNCETQKFEKATKISDGDYAKRTDPTEDVAEGVKGTPVQHPRISSLKGSINRQEFQSPKTPPTSTSGESSPKTPITELLEDMSPDTRKLVYEIMKANEAKISPLAKRRRLENVSDSPIDPKIMDPPNPFDIIDKNFVEPKKCPDSTPFKEYRRRFYIKHLGDKYVGTPLSVRSKSNVSPSPPPNVSPTPPPNARPSDENTDGGETKPDEIPEGVGGTQKRVDNFFGVIDEIRRRKSCAQQEPETVVSDTEENHPNESFREPDTEQIDYCDPDERQTDRFANGSRSSLRTLCFSFSLTIDADPQILKEQINKLGGTVCQESPAFDPTCTHLICSKPNQSEKTLSIIASGRWLLCPAYIEDSGKAGRFLNEEDYEWGNPKATSKLPELDSKSNKIAMVSHKWRRELLMKSKNENRPVGIFSGFRAILHSNRKDSFKRLLEAGCGEVVDLEEPYSEQKDFRGVTHCFVDKKMNWKSSTDMAAMRNAGVHCVSLLYLQACLQEDTLPTAKDYSVN